MTLRNLAPRIEYLEEITLPKKAPLVYRLVVMSAADDTVLHVIDMPAIARRDQRRWGQRHHVPRRMSVKHEVRH